MSEAAASLTQVAEPRRHRRRQLGAKQRTRDARGEGGGDGTHGGRVQGEQRNENAQASACSSRGTGAKGRAKGRRTTWRKGSALPRSPSANNSNRAISNFRRARRLPAGIIRPRAVQYSTDLYLILCTVLDLLRNPKTAFLQVFTFFGFRRLHFTPIRNRRRARP